METDIAQQAKPQIADQVEYQFNSTGIDQNHNRFNTIYYNVENVLKAESDKSYNLSEVDSESTDIETGNMEHSISSPYHTAMTDIDTAKNLNGGLPNDNDRHIQSGVTFSIDHLDKQTSSPAYLNASVSETVEGKSSNSLLINNHTHRLGDEASNPAAELLNKIEYKEKRTALSKPDSKKSTVLDHMQLMRKLILNETQDQNSLKNENKNKMLPFNLEGKEETQKAMHNRLIEDISEKVNNLKPVNISDSQNEGTNSRHGERDTTIYDTIKAASGKGDYINRLENTQVRDVEIFRQSMAKSVVSQVVRKVALDLNNQKAEIKIDIKPDLLGHIKIQVLTEHQQISAKIITETYFVKEMIEQNINQLKSELNQHGIEIDLVDVSVEEGSDFYYPEHNDEEKEKIKNLLSRNRETGEEIKSKQTNTPQEHTDREYGIDYYA